MEKDKAQEQILRQRLAMSQTGKELAGKDPTTLLRFVAFRCDFRAEGVQASYRDAPPRALPWTDIRLFAARQLPAEQPWAGAIVADLVPVSGTAPLRLLTGTFIGFGTLVGGAATSPVENVRRLGAHVLLMNPSLELEASTAPFVCEARPCPRVLSLMQFAEYDAQYS
jgi:hypothetical protein